MLRIHSVTAFKDNYIWLIGRTGTPEVAAVDPGDARPLLAYCAAHGLEPCAVLITHHHRDHAGGVRELLSHHDVPVYGPAHEPIPGLTHPLGEGAHVTLPEIGLTLQVLELPGHTRAPLSYTGAGMLFCGDTLFTGGCGYLFEGTAKQMYASLTRLAALPGETQVYCGHEYTLENLSFALHVEPDNPDLRARIAAARRLRAQGLPTVPSTLEEERRTNPFLRCHIPQVIEAAETYAERRLSTPDQVFAVVRQWKDTLDNRA
jgi:hydroxyacylglutathione hydrolase